MTSREESAALEHLRSLLAGDLSKVSEEELFRGIREAEQIQRDARGWTGRLVEEARRREIPWSRLERETGAPKATLHRRTLPPLEFDDDE